MNRCPRCRLRSRIIVTTAHICLSCAEYLADQGGSWQTGDDFYMSAVNAWIAESGAKYLYAMPSA